MTIAAPLGSAAPPTLWVITVVTGLTGAAVAGLLGGGVRPLLVFGLLIGAAVALAAVARPSVGLYALVLVTYSRLSDVAIEFHGAPSIAQPLIGMLLVLIGARRLLLGERRDGWQQPAALLAVYGGVLTLSLLYAPEFPTAAALVAAFVRDAAIVVLVVLLLRSPGDLRGTVWTLLAVGGALGTIGVYQYVTGSFGQDFGGFGQAEVLNIVAGIDDYRISGPIPDPNHYAQMLLVLVPLALGRVRRDPSLLRRLGALWVLVVVSGAIVFTFSRGALLALAAVGLIAVVQRPPHPVVVVAAVAAGLLALPVLPAGYTDRASGLVTAVSGQGGPRSESSLTGRLSAATVGLQMFADRPLLGVGAGQFPLRYSQYARPLGVDESSTTVEPHNLYVEAAAETGMLGLLAWGLVLAAAFRSLRASVNAFRRRGLDDTAAMVEDLRLAVVAYLLAGLFLHNAYPRTLWLLVGVALALGNVSASEPARPSQGRLMAA